MAEFKPVLLTLPSFAPSLALEVPSICSPMFQPDDNPAFQVLPYGLTIHRVIVQPDGRVCAIHE